MKVKLLTDTSCGISKEEAEKLGYELIALPFLIDDVEYDEFRISGSEFYEKLRNCKEVHTSQAPINVVTEAFDRILKDYDHIIYLPITSGLSSSYESILPIIDSNENYKNRITVIDHKTISVLQRAMLEDVVRLLDKGYEIPKIKELIEVNAKNNRIYIAVDTLSYLSKGGRMNAFSATIGNMLNIKPILFSNGNKFEVVKKARGTKAAEDELKNFVLTDLNKLFPGEPMDNFVMGVAYTECIDEATKYKAIMEDALQTTMIMDELSAVIGCHTGYGTIGSAIYRRVNGD